MAMHLFRLRIARALAYVFRFRTLQIAEWSLNHASRQDPQDVVGVTLFGYRLPLKVSRSITHRLLCVEGERFIQERFLLRGLLQDGDVVIDVGANIGYLSLLFRRAIGPAGQLICVEPDPDNFEELQRCLPTSRFQNTVLLNSAAGEAERQVQLKPGLNGHISCDGLMNVRQITLDSLAHWHPDFVKIDVEGYEGNVIAGARQLLAEYKPTIFLELHPSLVPDRGDIRRIVEYLDGIYDSVEFFEYCMPSGAFAKFLMRYGVTAAISQLDDRQRLLAGIDRFERDRPFWAVCRVGSRAIARDGGQSG